MEKEIIYVNAYEKLIVQSFINMKDSNNISENIYDDLCKFFKIEYIKNNKKVDTIKSYCEIRGEDNLKLSQKSSRDSLYIAGILPIFIVIVLLLKMYFVLLLPIFVLIYGIGILSLGYFLKEKRRKQYYIGKFNLMCVDMINSLNTIECEICNNSQTDFNLKLKDTDMYKCEHGHIFCKKHLVSSDQKLAIDLLKSRENYYINKYNGSDKDIQIEKVQETLKAIGYEGYDDYEKIFNDYNLIQNYPSEYCPVCNKQSP